MNTGQHAAASTAPYPATRELAAWVADLTFEVVPGAVVEHLKSCVLDALGCGLFGARQPWGVIASDMAVTLSGGGPASLFGRRDRASVADAALANGTAVHGFELDDAHTASSLHPGAVVVPAVLALAQARAISGKEMLTAVAAGYETGLRLGNCAGVGHSTSGFHVTGTVGSVAAAAGAARAICLPAEAAAHALGVGATQASGLYCARFGAMTKRLHAGHAAQAGVLGACLAQAGFTGATDVIEAESGGFLKAFRGDGDPASIVRDLGRQWETLKVGFKLYAACASAHTTIDAVRSMRARGLRADRLKRLTISLSRKGFHNIGWPYRPAGVMSAQMNGSFAAASALLFDDVSVAQYAPDRLASPPTLALVERIECRHEPRLDIAGPAGRHTVEIVAELDDGSRMEERVEHRTGSAGKPLSPAMLERKFRSLAGAAGLHDAAIERLLDLTGALDRLPSIEPLGQALCGEL